MKLGKSLLAMSILVLSLQASATTVSLAPTANVSVIDRDSDFDPYVTEQG